MNRAAVLIGVRDTGGLPRLQTVYDGITMMRNWAESQGIVGDSLVILTDEQQPVSADKVLDAISSLARALTYDQLVIYYSGHGLNLGQCEYWLLSDFPQDSRTIINLAASIERARTGTIPHVVFISDACRTPATTIIQQVAAMSGGAMSIFPNPTTGSVGKFKAVDVFYATVLGRPSLEVLDDQDGERSYRGIYTEALVDALNGKPPMQPDPLPA